MRYGRRRATSNGLRPSASPPDEANSYLTHPGPFHCLGCSLVAGVDFPGGACRRRIALLFRVQRHCCGARHRSARADGLWRRPGDSGGAKWADHRDHATWDGGTFADAERARAKPRTAASSRSAVRRNLYLWVMALCDRSARHQSLLAVFRAGAELGGRCRRLLRGTKSRPAQTRVTGEPRKILGRGDRVALRDVAICRYLFPEAAAVCADWGGAGAGSGWKRGRTDRRPMRIGIEARRRPQRQWNAATRAWRLARSCR